MSTEKLFIPNSIFTLEKFLLKTRSFKYFLFISELVSNLQMTAMDKK